MAYIDNACQGSHLEAAADKLLWGVFYNTGQSRSSIESILVHKSEVNKFTNILSEKVFETLKLINPMDEASNYGCISWAEQVELLDEIV
jgi:acyl-CoA reductase-like NAD-dependent aldehyde dehydrogenase